MRINSVKGTLKITSAMKLVASAKLISAEKSVRALLPYRDTLSSMLRDLQSAAPAAMSSGGGDAAKAHAEPSTPYSGSAGAFDAAATGAVAIIAVASNSSLCGGFNANAVKAALECAKAQSGDVTVFSIGKKMADTMRRCGYPSPKDLNQMSSKPKYEDASVLASEFMSDCARGRFSRVYLIYNHFVTTSRQEVLTEIFLGPDVSTASLPPRGAEQGDYAPRNVNAASYNWPSEYIIEPSPSEAIDRLLPLTLKVRLFAALLDSNAAEHAARLVAMQTATDNGEELLHEITLEYNKARQQKITSEILDLASSGM